MFIVFSLLFIPLLAGMMFVPVNGFYGVRCSWTLKSPKVWDVVHKYAGYASVVSIASSLASTFSGDVGVDYCLLVLVFNACFTSLVFAYIAHKKITLEKASDTSIIVKALASKTFSCAVIVAAIFCINYCILEQAELMAQYGDNKIASNFNANGIANGWSKASRLLEFFSNKQTIGASVILLCSFALIPFTKDTICARGDIFGKLITATMCASLGIASMSFYFLCIFISVHIAQTSGKFDMFTGDALAMLMAGFFIATILTPTLLMFKAVDRINEKVLCDSN